MAKHVQTENSDFLRDTSSLALINKNLGDFEQRKAQRQKFIEQEHRIKDLEALVGRLSDMILNRGN